MKAVRDKLSRVYCVGLWALHLFSAFTQIASLVCLTIECRVYAEPKVNHVKKIKKCRPEAFWSAVAYLHAEKVLNTRLGTWASRARCVTPSQQLGEGWTFSQSPQTGDNKYRSRNKWIWIWITVSTHAKDAPFCPKFENQKLGCLYTWVWDYYIWSVNQNLWCDRRCVKMAKLKHNSDNKM